MFEPTARPDFFTAEHEAFRASLRSFVQREIEPHISAWEEAGSVPLALHRKAAAIGLLGLGYPDALGGTPGDIFYSLISGEELARPGAGGVQCALGTHQIALPPVRDTGSAALQQRVIPPVISGEKVAALAITEPGGGSDVAALRTTATKEGDTYVVNGEKTFISSGIRADFLTVAVRTTPQSKGASGISLLLVEGDTPGLQRTPLKKMGWWASDTAHLRFDQCRVPVSNLIGEEGAGFKAIMKNFNNERLMMATLSVAYAQACAEEALAWARERHTFGEPLVQRQVIRHKLMDMAFAIERTRTFIYDLAWRLHHQLDTPQVLVARTCMAKVEATRTMQLCADTSVQILGGMGFMQGTKSERLYREVKVMMIGGGSEEIMKDLAARQLGV
jgi:acyl-CoA dehydrogenase